MLETRVFSECHTWVEPELGVFGISADMDMHWFAWVALVGIEMESISIPVEHFGHMCSLLRRHAPSAATLTKHIRLAAGVVRFVRGRTQFRFLAVVEA